MLGNPFPEATACDVRKFFHDLAPRFVAGFVQRRKTFGEAFPVRAVTRGGFREWITKQSFLPLSKTEVLNWSDCYYEEEKSEVLSRFTWIGEEYAIYRVTQRHTKCDARWYEYYAGKAKLRQHEGYTRFFAYEYRDRHISDVLRTLGKRCDDISSAVVETRYSKDGPTMSYFMDEFIGYDLSYEQVCDAKECRLRKAREDYNGANAYYYKLKENEKSIRGIEAVLLVMREQIQKAKNNKYCYGNR